MSLKVQLPSAALCLLLLIAASSAVWMEVDYNTNRCVSEDFMPSLLVQGVYNVTPLWTASQMSFSVYDPSDHILVSKTNIDNGNFAFTTDQAGVHRFCFMDKTSDRATPPTKRKANLDTKTGAQTKSFLASGATKDALKPIEVEVLRIEESVNDINKELRYMRRREEKMRDTNESTYSRLIWLSLLSIVIISLSGIWQIVYLKRFFQKKKLI